MSAMDKLQALHATVSGGRNGRRVAHASSARHMASCVCPILCFASLFSLTLLHPLSKYKQVSEAWLQCRYYFSKYFCSAEDLPLVEAAEFFCDCLPHSEEVRRAACLRLS
jgi:hypothetical protein